MPKELCASRWDELLQSRSRCWNLALLCQNAMFYQSVGRCIRSIPTKACWVVMSTHTDTYFISPLRLVRHHQAIKMHVSISAATSKVQQWQTDERSDLDCQTWINWRPMVVKCVISSLRDLTLVNTSASACYQLFMSVLYFVLPTLKERIEGHVHFCRFW